MLIGREKEIDRVNVLLNSSRSEFAVIYGRRRVGKTYLMREAFSRHFTFYHTGMANSGMADQLEKFAMSLSDAGCKLNSKLSNWNQAFQNLKKVIEQSKHKKKLIFLDELPWMDTPKSKFLQELEHFWNSWCSMRNDVVLVACGSATSWIIDNVINNRGGLYNRVTCQIYIRPFTLKECATFCECNNLKFSRLDILHFYMIAGGIPYYWSLLSSDLPLSQNVDKLCFSRGGELVSEYHRLYSSLFKKPDTYLKIISSLAKKKTGMTRDELAKESGIGQSGVLTRMLAELEQCDFIRKYNFFGNRSKGAMYQLIDAYTLFYYKFIESNSLADGFWSKIQGRPIYNTWCGLAFERVCLLHTGEIKKALGISGVLTSESAWYVSAEKSPLMMGSQIDLVIDRQDAVINLCEMKYSKGDCLLDANDEQCIRDKNSNFSATTKTRKALRNTLITTFNVVKNTHFGVFDNVLTLDDLME